MKMKGMRKPLIQFKNEHLTVFESQLYKTTSTVIQTEDCIILVDPNWLPQEVNIIKEYIEQIKQNKPVYLLFTHSDWDHIIGYGAFLEATIIASKGFHENREKEQIIEQIHAFDHQYYIDRDYPILYPPVDIIIQEDGQKLEIGGTSLTFYMACGHTDDGIFTIVEPLGIWIAGDYLSDVEFPYIYSSSEKYEATLLKCDEILKRHSIRILIPGHGHAATSMEEILQRKKEALNYIHELRKTIIHNLSGEDLIKKYAYPKGMKVFHEGNIKLMKKELGI